MGILNCCFLYILICQFLCIVSCCLQHPAFKGRIRKRMGDRAFGDLENIAFTIKYELGIT